MKKTTLRLLELASAMAAALFFQGCSCPVFSSALEIRASNPEIRYSGRSEWMKPDEVVFGYSGARMRMRFEGTSVAARISDDTGNNYAVVFVDGQMRNKIRLNAKDGYYSLAEGLSEGAHTVEIVRATECDVGLTRFHGFVLPEGGKILPWGDKRERKIEFIGDSITCAYGVEAENENAHFSPETENFCLGYSGLTARALDADYLVVSRSGIGIVRNFDGPYEGAVDTMTDIYPYTFYRNTEYKWDYSRFTPDVVCINLGTNDFSTDGPEKLNSDKFVDTLTNFSKEVLVRYPEAKLVILEGPMGSDNDPMTPPVKAALVRTVQLLEAYAPGRVNYVRLTPEGKVGYGADWHPNARQSEINAGELTRYLSDLMDWPVATSRP